MPEIHYTRFPVDGEAANLLQQVVVMEFGKRHDGLMDLGLKLLSEWLLRRHLKV